MLLNTNHIMRDVASGDMENLAAGSGYGVLNVSMSESEEMEELSHINMISCSCDHQDSHH